MNIDEKKILITKCLLLYNELNPTSILVFSFQKTLNEYPNHGPLLILKRSIKIIRVMLSYFSIKELRKMFGFRRKSSKKQTIRGCISFLIRTSFGSRFFVVNQKSRRWKTMMKNTLEKLKNYKIGEKNENINFRRF